VKNKVMKPYVWRYYTLAFLLAVLFALLIGRVAMLQLSDEGRGRAFLQQQGDARSIRTLTVPASRGVITDRNGEILAMSTPVESLWINPKYFEAKDDAIKVLAKVSGEKESAFRARLQRNSKQGFMFIERQISPEKAKEVLAYGFKGVHSQTEYKRFYPAGDVISQVVGFTNISDQGQEGIELAFNDQLAGHPGRKQVMKDLNGNVIREIAEVEAPKQGGQIQLAIDLRLQYVAQRELAQALTNFGAKAGTVVMLDVNTGELLAMASQPSFNPNNRRNMKIDHVRNRALTDVLEPGSTAKPLSMIAALKSGKYTPKTVVDTNPGYIRIERKVFPDPVNYGVIDVTKILAKSSQVGMSKVALDIGNAPIRSVLLSLGFGESTYSRFPGESSGLFPVYDREPTGIETATMAFGYGFAVTPVQLASAYATLASGGIKRPVSLLKVESDVVAGERVIEEGVAKQVVNMLREVVKLGGTGTMAATELYGVAGKTGTAHKVGKGGYADSKYLALFAGIAPVDNPRIAAVVVIDEPAGNRYHGGQVAAPVFSRVVNDSLRILNVRPSVSVNEKVAVTKGQGVTHAG
jgi:cell division protein FtsI (penicillin-binding protein 3)